MVVARAARFVPRIAKPSLMWSTGCSFGASTRAPRVRGSAMVSTAASAEQPAVSSSTCADGSTANPTPASAGPTRNDAPNRAWRMPEMRSIVVPPSAAISGSIACRAVIPGTSNSAPSTPSRMNQPMVSPTVESTRNRRVTEMALPRSARIVIRRRPKRSMSEPPRTAARKAGAAVAAATMPAAAASPVRASTSQGRVSAIAELPSSEVKSAVKYSITARFMPPPCRRFGT